MEMLLIGANTMAAIEKLLARLAEIESYVVQLSYTTVGQLLETQVDELNACLLQEIGTYTPQTEEVLQ